MTRLLTIMGSGETAPTMVKPHRQVFERLATATGGATTAEVPAVFLDTPFGFQENADELSSKTVDYFRATGRSAESVSALEAYFKAQGLFGMPAAGALSYSQVLELDLGSVVPSIAGPKRPQDRIALTDVATKFSELIAEGTKRFSILPMADVESAYYMRLRAADQPGVLADITRILADCSISIDAMVQKEPSEGEEQVDIIMLTHETREKRIKDAIGAIEKLAVVFGRGTRIRLEGVGRN